MDTSSANAASTSSQLAGTLTLKKSAFNVDGSKVATPNLSTMPPSTLALFTRRNTSGSYTNGAYMKCYGFKITRNDAVVHEYKPARRVTDGVLGMYDTVTKQFLTNVGTGKFVTE